MALALSLLPALVPPLARSLSGDAPRAYWYLSRASALVAYVLLWASMMAGLGITGKLARTWPGIPSSFELHRFTSLAGLGFGLAHALLLLGDRYINYTLAQVLVPFIGRDYRPEWVGLGQVAFYALSIVAFSFYFRDRLGTRAWRLIHSLSFGLFIAALLHGLMSGTDSSNRLVLGMYAASAVSVLFATIYRLISVRMGRPKDSPGAAGLVVAPGRAQPRPHSAQTPRPRRSPLIRDSDTF
jgi:predicted ferric reductase